MSGSGMQCPCRTVPEGIDGDTLLLRCPVNHSFEVIDEVLATAGAEFERRAQVREIHTGSVQPLVLELAAALTRPERRAIRCLVLRRGSCSGAGLGDAALGAMDLDTLAARIRYRHLADLAAQPERFHSRYQPLIDLGSHEVVGFEALLRASDEQGKEIPAGALFGAAAAGGWTDLLDRIGRETAITDAAGWLGERQLFINFVPTSIYRPEVCLATTIDAARRSGVPLDRLVFEVVESHRTDDPDHLLSIVAQYRSKGAKVALDDVGTGYSTLALVARLQPDVVKVDMELVQQLPDPVATSIVGSIVELSHGIGAKVIAEGIETEEQAAAVTALGIDIGQGWLYGRPALPADLRESLSA